MTALPAIESVYVFQQFAGTTGGGGFADGTGAAARFGAPYDVAVDPSGYVYVADQMNATIRKVSPSGEVTTFAGQTGWAGHMDGQGTAAQLSSPTGLALDRRGNLFVADGGRLRKISPAGAVLSIAEISHCTDVAVDDEDTLMVCSDTSVVWKILSSGAIVQIGGSEGSADGDLGTAQFRRVNGVAFDHAGTAYVADSGNYTIRKITRDGKVTTLAGLAGQQGSVDGTGAEARFNWPSAMAVDKAGNLYVTDRKDAIRKITPAGVVTTVAGASGRWGSEDGMGGQVSFRVAAGLALDQAGTLYVADTENYCIRKMSDTGNVTTWVGAPAEAGHSDGQGSAARFTYPAGMARDRNGDLYVAENHVIRKISRTGMVTTVAGSAGEPGFADGVGSAARFYYPSGIAVDAAGMIYVADSDNDAIRKIAPDGQVSTVAGVPHRGYRDGPVETAGFSFPAGVAVNEQGTIYVSERTAGTIRQISPEGQVSTLAGDPANPSAYVSVDGTGTAARFDQPTRLAIGPAGEIYVVGLGGHARKVTPAGVVTTLVGLGGGGIAVDQAGNVYTIGLRLSKLSAASGTVTKLGGSTRWNSGNVDGAGIMARFRDPTGLAVDPDGTFYIADSGNRTIRVGRPMPAPTVVWPEPAAIPYGTPLSTAQLNATADVSAGRFSYRWPSGTVLPMGGHILEATWTPDDPTAFPTIAVEQAITIERARPVITWPTPTAVVEGSTLSATQLNAVASVPGFWAYSPQLGTVVGVGAVTLSVTFTPEDQILYQPTTKEVILQVVSKRQPKLSWVSGVTLPFGSVLSEGLFSPTADVPGVFSYTPQLGSSLPLGDHTVTLTFTPTDTEAYAPVSAAVSLKIGPATPVLTWSAAEGVKAGTPLAEHHLGVEANVPGTFAYTPALGTVLSAGVHTVRVNFTPTDRTTYTTATADVSLSVNKLVPQISWMAPKAIVYGTALSADQLNATADLPGTFTYSPAAGAVLDAGPNRTLTVSFTPADSVNHASASAQTWLLISQADPVFTWPAPAPIRYGTALSSAHFNATSKVPGTFVYNQEAGQVVWSDIGTHVLLTAVFYPNDTVNYRSVFASTELEIEKAPLIIKADDKAKIEGTENPTFTFTYSGWVNGDTPASLWRKPEATTSATKESLAGTYRIVPLEVSAFNYEITLQDGSLTVTKAAVAPTIRSGAAASVVVGQALNFAVTANGTPAPTFSASGLPAWARLDPATGVLSGTPPDVEGSPFSISLTASNGTEPAATQTLQLSVTKGRPAVTWPQPEPVTYGVTLSTRQLNATTPVAGAFTYVPASGTVPDAGGNQTLRATFTPVDTASYAPVEVSRTLMVNKARLTVKAENKAKVQGAANPPFTLSYSGFVNGDTAAVLDTAVVVSTTATATSPVGTYPITVTGGADNNYSLWLESGTLSVTNSTQAPAFTSVSSALFTVGRSGSVTFAATGTPAPTFAASGLPAWASLHPNTGVLSGTPPDASGSPLAFSVTASNGTAPDATMRFSLTVQEAESAPSFTRSPVGQVVAPGRTASFTVAVQGAPTPTVRWQVSLDRGGTWTEVGNDATYSGASGPTLTVAGVTTAFDGRRFRAVATNRLGETVSAAAMLTVATATSDFAGIYLGTLSGSSGCWALAVRTDRTATFIAYLPERASAVVVELSVAADGTFGIAGTELGATAASAARGLGGTGAGARAANAFTLTGTITAAGTIAGALDGLGVSFSGSAEVGGGSWGAAAGTYEAPALGLAGGASYAIVAPSGQAVIVTVTADGTDGATGTVAADGTLTATTATGGQLRVTLGAAAQQLTTTLTPAGATKPVVFAGLADGVESTTRLVNLSVLSQAGPGDKALTVGFVLSGTGTKPMLVRAAGPALTSVGVNSGYLADPRLRLYSAAGAELATNDQWGGAAALSTAFQAVGAFGWAHDSKDAALWQTLAPAPYTAQASAPEGATPGYALVEAYDGATTTGVRLVNLSTLKKLSAADNVLIVGFVLTGNAPKTVLLRGVGPSLAEVGVGLADTLTDPQLTLYTQAGAELAVNDDWGGGATLKRAFATLGAFGYAADASKDAALLVTLQPGIYTARVGAVGAAAGYTLVEIYEVP